LLQINRQLYLINHLGYEYHKKKKRVSLLDALLDFLSKESRPKLAVEKIPAIDSPKNHMLSIVFKLRQILSRDFLNHTSSLN